ncbi:hypothetical protein EB796_006308 [Bugula neritina]|uniref:Uncharacterized protein n=1 Tax=Bugula neritina TaxID=10212 RepID=A0A7J7KCY4_BUGNE|nr:hypothetical protein EB796_006308 [Bugula neritina]
MLKHAQKLQETLSKIERGRSEEVNIIKSLESCLSHVSIEERCRLLRRNNTLQSVAEKGQYRRYQISARWCITIKHAAWDGHTDIIKCLLDGVSVDKKVELLKSRYGNTAIHSVAEEGHTDTIKYLLDGVSVDKKVELLKIQSRDGDPAIHEAACKGHRMIKLMMDKLSAKQQLELLQTHNTKKHTPLSIAERKGQTNTVSYLKQCQDKAEHRVQEYSRRFTPQPVTDQHNSLPLDLQPSHRLDYTNAK